MVSILVLGAAISCRFRQPELKADLSWCRRLGFLAAVILAHSRDLTLTRFAAAEVG